MKRVFLVSPGAALTDGAGVLVVEPEVVRAASVALGLFAVDDGNGRNVGDPVHEWVTEGRRSQYERALAAGAEWARKMPAGYSSCGDLAHFVLFCLGVRDERYVNRSTDGGTHPWESGVNVSRLVALPAYVDAKHAAGRVPKAGDVLHVAAPDHVAICSRWDEAGGVVESCDYGQPYGRERKHPITRRGSVTLVGARVLMGWIEIDQIAVEESALVPNDFALGIVDENPYPEGFAVPAGVP